MIYEKQIRYYKSFDEDFVESSDQNYTLPEDYIWIRKGRSARMARSILYSLGCIAARVYGTFVLHAKIVRNADLKEFCDTGAVVYGNHTQPIGDVFMPALVCTPKQCYTVAAPANLGIPFLGAVLPWMGALPVPDSFRGMAEFNEAIAQRLREKNCIIVYPEAHVWPFYTEVRPYPATSFSYAVKNHVPAFCMTTTYQARRYSHKPRVTIYLDGPFEADPDLPEREKRTRLRDQVFSCMQERSRLSTYRYIEYRPEEE